MHTQTKKFKLSVLRQLKASGVIVFDNASACGKDNAAALARHKHNIDQPLQYAIERTDGTLLVLGNNIIEHLIANTLNDAHISICILAPDNTNEDAELFYILAP